MSRTPPVLIYDGECPFCSNYVEWLKLKESFPELQLLNAREAAGHPALLQVQHMGLRLDDGMALVDGETVYHGADVLHQLSSVNGNGLANRMHRAVFGSARRSRVFYPGLRAIRNLTLRVLGRNKLGF